MIKFYAKSNQLVRVPGAQPNIGQPDMYVGRVFDLEKRAYPASSDPYVVDENSGPGQRLLHLARLDNCLLPADEYTASLMGVPFVEYEFKDGAFVEKQKSPNKQTKEG